MRFLLLLVCLLSSCVQFSAQSGAKYSGPPWGKVAYSNGQEMFTSDHDAGWVATVTAAQNIITTVGGEEITGQVTKAITTSNNALKATQGAQAASVANTTTAARTAVSEAAIKANPTAVVPPKITAP